MVDTYFLIARVITLNLSVKRNKFIFLQTCNELKQLYESRIFVNICGNAC